MSDIDPKKLCRAVCTPSLDGYTPNPLYEQGYCPSYMQQQCNADGTMFEEQWDKHQEDIKHFNANRMFAMTMGFKPVPYTNSGVTIPLPPTTSVVLPTYSQQPVQYYEEVTTTKKKPRKKSSKKVSKKKTAKKSTKKKSGKKK